MAWHCRLTRKRLLLLLIPLGFLGAIVWHFASNPPDPVYQGHRLSWWVEHEWNERGYRFNADDIRMIGAPAVRWLTYKAEHARTLAESNDPQRREIGRRILYRVGVEPSE
jgi:hypothetical protein